MLLRLDSRRPWLTRGGVNSSSPLILLDTDIDSDCDDVAALALLLQLEYLGECQIISVTTASNNTNAAPCADTILKYAGRGSIPVGAYKGSSISGGSSSLYTSPVVSTNGPTNGVSAAATRTDYSDATTILRQRLAALPRKGVIVTIGTQTNISALLASAGDGISALTGAQLVAAKVDRIVAMGTQLPASTAENNISLDLTAAQDIATNTPVPVYWVPYGIGSTVLIGFPSYLDTVRDPFSTVWTAAASQLTGSERESWDPSAVLYAIRANRTDLFSITGPGTLSFDGSSLATFTLSGAGKHYYVSKVASDAALKSMMNALLVACTQRVDVWGPTWATNASQTIATGNNIALSVSEVATFSIVGGADQAQFSISTSTLVCPAALGAYAVTVRATDTKGNYTDQAFTITVQAAAWTPATLTPNLWVDASDLSTLFQSNAGSTAVASDGDLVGYAGDKSGAGFHITSAADDTTRPTYKTSGGHSWINFDGSDDVLRRLASLGMYAAGACSIFMAVRGNPTVSTVLVSERKLGSNTPIYIPIEANPSSPSKASIFVRNDANVSLVAHNAVAVVNTFDNTDRVYGIIDDGSNLITYVNGVAGSTVGYTRSGTLNALDRFSLGASVAVSTGSWFAGRVYALVIVNRVISAGERANLVTWLGNKMGLSL